MGAYLVAFSGDPLEKTEYEIKVESCLSGYNGTVWAKKSWQEAHPEGRFNFWKSDPADLLFRGWPMLDQRTAADDAARWCRENGVTGWFGPALSGDIG